MRAVFFSAETVGPESLIWTFVGNGMHSLGEIMDWDHKPCPQSSPEFVKSWHNPLSTAKKGSTTKAATGFSCGFLLSFVICGGHDPLPRNVLD